ncbi:MFS general substrate transporter [Venustampulla echinocandica]|uniref:MFS general substrate transporter n=1 Tax=Venustampulla echinocandica TaxID=2656787 RepID=A0A370TN92_9HELO|nr:MFS general substrate transporter [Venustampulla echinocandica]RDL36991.1 MFS general substrate transporter [Venustampulla echinocandica]
MADQDRKNEYEMGPRPSAQSQDDKHAEVEVKVIKGNEAFNEAMLKEPPRPFTWSTTQLYAACFIGFFCATMNGYDGSLINNLLQNPWFLEYYHGENAGIWAGIVTSMYQIGGVVSLPFVGPAADTYGRRFGMWIGCLIIIVGTIIQGVATRENGTKQFMGGRFLLGFGVNIASAAGPMYVVEVSHPAYRGIVTAIFNCFWFTGSIIASGVARGGLNAGGNLSWRLVIWIQLMFSGIILIAAYFLPESPRWLYVNSKPEAARNMLTKYHGEGNPDSEWVKLQLNEYEELLEMDGADKRWWDYSALFKNRSTCYRLFCNVSITIFGQWAGNAVLSYFLGKVLGTVGIHSTFGQANITLINNCQQFLFALLGANLVDRVGRRPLLLFSNIGCCVVWLAMTVSAGLYQKSIPPLPPGADPDTELYGTNKAAGTASLAFIFIFGAVYSVGFTPLQALYPVEVLSFEMRAKGMGFSGFTVAAAGLLNQFAWPVALEKIGWKTYIIFTVWCGIQATVIYFFIPETKNRTLEELDEIFNAKNPVKESIAKKRLGFDAYGEVINIQDA